MRLCILWIGCEHNENVIFISAYNFLGCYHPVQIFVVLVERQGQSNFFKISDNVKISVRSGLTSMYPLELFHIFYVALEQIVPADAYEFNNELFRYKFYYISSILAQKSHMDGSTENISIKVVHKRWYHNRWYFKKIGLIFPLYYISYILYKYYIIQV